MIFVLTNINYFVILIIVSFVYNFCFSSFKLLFFNRGRYATDFLFDSRDRTDVKAVSQPLYHTVIRLMGM